MHHFKDFFTLVVSASVPLPAGGPWLLEESFDALASDERMLVEVSNDPQHDPFGAHADVQLFLNPSRPVVGKRDALDSLTDTQALACSQAFALSQQELFGERGRVALNLYRRPPVRQLPLDYRDRLEWDQWVPLARRWDFYRSFVGAGDGATRQLPEMLDLPPQVVESIGRFWVGPEWFKTTEGRDYLALS